jgi:hypothetical protein
MEKENVEWKALLEDEAPQYCAMIESEKVRSTHIQKRYRKALKFVFCYLYVVCCCICTSRTKYLFQC